MLTIEEDGVPQTYVRVWDPEGEDWIYVPDEDVPRALPDPNEEGSPDRITILDDEGVPLTYVKVADPDGEGFMYIPDDEVPLASPDTGDTSLLFLWAGMCFASVEGLIALRPHKRRREEEQ